MHLLQFKPKNLMIVLGVIAGTISSCKNTVKNNSTMTDSITTDKALPSPSGFEQTIDGKQVKLYILKGKNGMQAAITNYGGRIVSLLVKDQNNKMVDVVAGFDNLKGYQESTSNYYGALIGRYGNRIANGHFKLDGKDYNLFINNAPNTLHGGKVGFDSKVWDAEQPNEHQLVLTYHSADMEEGFPGNLDVKVTYSVTRYNSLEIMYQATTDKKTVVNLTNHAYFNLNGWGSGDILKHVMQINADEYTPVDKNLIPTGKLASLKETPFDFRAPLPIGDRINKDNEQLKIANGYDHNYVLNKHNTQIPVATVIGDQSGLIMKVFTTEPGMQFYTGNFMKGAYKMKGGHPDDFRTAFCLETQHFPDSPNKPEFPSTVLEPGKTYKSLTLYQFERKFH
ncbi:aldose epimerase family protein [Mucilaginibacter sp. KACC 22063]|uniref:aldose epimerase family protein n=1 Tax=Mucilaginibacter sp. KACC 22063 TaxID=3025666 RepID=UPI002366BC2A|nr:aldose epimerase family protein [Mucilaginibacter sp. KACC 22063]WDF56609.1 galactose mutarotase [Mucilaginibacter sp. KACC 22063]